jgi:hypothetical protein
MLSFNLKLNLRKCCFGARKITFFGHVVDQQGLWLDLVKIHVVSRFPIPFIITNVKVFLGLTKYYQAFIHGYAKIVGID